MLKGSHPGREFKSLASEHIVISFEALEQIEGERLQATEALRKGKVPVVFEVHRRHDTPLKVLNQRLGGARTNKQCCSRADLGIAVHHLPIRQGDRTMRHETTSLLAQHNQAAI